MTTKYLTSPTQISTMPKGIPYIVGNEAAERFSFYGMRGILVIFMTKYILDSSGAPAHFDEHTANAWYHNFIAVVYFFPILGAVVSDWLFGKYMTILSLSLVYCAGHAVLALIDTSLATMVEPKLLLLCGLALIAFGSGGIKPCVSAHVGDQFGEANRHLIPRVFRWFYFAINFGSAASMILTPLLLKYVGPGLAFGVPGILMGIATLVFWMGRRKFVHIQPTGNRFFTNTFSKNGLRAIGNLVPLYILVAMFWCLFDQTSSAWIHQAIKMDRVILDTTLFGQSLKWEFLPAQVQVTNPVLVMILIPVFSFIVYPFLGRFFKVTPLRRIGIGLFLTVPAFVIPALLEARIVAGETPPIIWHIVAYVIITSAEVMVSITCLEFSYTQAPRAMKSFIMGLYLLSVTLGNVFAAQVNNFIGAQKEQGYTYLDGANYYWFFAVCMLVTAVIFVIWSQSYRGETFIQKEETAVQVSLEETDTILE